MRLPANFARLRLSGAGHGQNSVIGWKVRVFDRAAFIPCTCLRHPGGVRKRLEKVLGLAARAERTEEELVTMRSRQSATHKRIFRNRLASGEKIVMPWLRGRRRVQDVANEERVLDIYGRLQRVREYRK